MTAPQDPFSTPGDRPAGGSMPVGGSGPTGPEPTGPPPGGQPWDAPPAQQQWGPPPGQQWGGAPYGTAPAGPKRNGFGTAALVLGILALVTCWTLVGGVVLGIAAIVLGVLGRGRAKRGEADNGGSAIAGIVLGALGLVLALVLFSVGVAFFQSDSGQGLVDCLSEAGDDAAAQQACQTEFEEGVGN